jgi:hypothetical protein
MYDLFDKDSAKVILCMHGDDSLIKIADRTWMDRDKVELIVEDLVDNGYVEFDEGEDTFQLVDEGVREAALELVAANVRKQKLSLLDLYKLPSYCGHPFGFTNVDISMWTMRLQEGWKSQSTSTRAPTDDRTLDDWPIHLGILEEDIDDWKAFFRKCDVPVACERQPRDDISRPYQVVLSPRDSLDVEWKHKLGAMETYVPRVPPRDSTLLDELNSEPDAMQKIMLSWVDRLVGSVETAKKES